MTPRIYLTGSIAIEHEGRLVSERSFPGRQGRLAFAYLVANRHRTIQRDDLVSAIWCGGEAGQADTALDAIISKLRGVMRTAGLPASESAIVSMSGTIALTLPHQAWVDIEVAANALDEAEGALRRGDVAVAWSQANVAVAIGRRTFLADAEMPWIEARRSRQRASLVRAPQCLATVCPVIGDPLLSVQYAGETVELEPFRETGYQLLMRAHAAMGDRAEALRVFARCRELLRDELGVSPSLQTEAVYLEILRAG